MTSREEELQSRITKLETMYMHLQSDYEALNETVLMNVTKLDRMMSQLTEISNKLPTQMDGGQIGSLEDEKPPHY